MSSDFFEDTAGNQWWADFDEIGITLRMWAQAKAYLDSITIVENNDLREQVFDASGFRAARERYHQREMGTVSEFIYTDPNRVVAQLIDRYQDQPRLENQRRRQTQRMQSHNHQVISRRVTMAERTVTALQFTRDISAAIFMCCIPVSGLGAGAAMLARLGGSVFQGVATYQDTGNAGAAFVSGALSFKSSLMVLPETAGRAAQIIFTIVNTGNTAVGNSAVRMMTVERGSTTSFTNVLREELVNGGLSAASEPVIGAINDRLAGQVLPIMTGIARDQAASAVASALQPADGQATTNSTARRAIAAARLRQELNSRQRATDEAAWRSTPFYRYMESGDPNVLLSEAQQHVMGYLLRRGD
ncbi:MAG: hypothetical protein R2681_12555 [Pyrinomonadaceae bacterium]